MALEANGKVLGDVAFSVRRKTLDLQLRSAEPMGESLQVFSSGASTRTALMPAPKKRLARFSQRAREASAMGARALRGVGYIVRMVSDDALSRSYWPEAQRKGKPRILAELLWWLIRHGEINHFYYLYGFDRKDVRRSDVMPYKAFRSRRNRLNLRVGRMPYNYVCVLRDKFLFAQLLTSLGVPTPRTFALFDRTTATWLESKTQMPLASIAAAVSSRYDGFCKRIDGTQGQGAFPLQIDKGRISSNGQELSSDEFCKLIDGRFLFQERIEQHPQMSALHPASVNTVRVITFYRSGKPMVFCASARMGTGGRTVDNWSAGGLTIGVDSATGELQREAFFKPGAGGRATKHPDTHVVFEGFRIPHFQEAVDLVLRLHEYLPQVHSIGWDIAISTQGPVVIEGNDDWHGVVPMLHEHDSKHRLHALFQSSER